MFGFDDWIAGLGGNGLMALAAALLLGLRHATDPDHLTTISTLVLSDRRDGARRAGALGLAWGLGHATTLLAFGLPVVLFRRYLPEGLMRGAEVAIGLVIIVLAIRLLLRWAQGYFHIRRRAAHPTGHVHPHAQALGRTPLAAFGIGMVHGIGGSAGVGILVVGAASSQVIGVAALVLFALATALSMALVSSCFGYALVRGSVARRLGSLIPALALASLAFGGWYALEAVRGQSLF